MRIVKRIRRVPTKRPHHDCKHNCYFSGNSKPCPYTEKDELVCTLDGTYIFVEETYIEEV